MTYGYVHAKMRHLLGSASTHVCRCGEPAEDWAYQHTAGDRELRAPDGTTPYSLDPDDYAPMCRPCHARFDVENDPARQIRRADPAFREAMRERGQDVGNMKAEMMQADPEFAERMREASRRGAMTIHQRMLDDPEFGNRLRDVRRANHAVRRRCDECGKTSSPCGMGTHQKKSGHQGWTRVEEN